MKEEELYELVEHIMFNDLMDVELAVKSIKNYVRKMCELQKQECAKQAVFHLLEFRTKNGKTDWHKSDKNYESFCINDGCCVKIDKESILNCKNVCDDNR